MKYCIELSHFNIMASLPVQKVAW